MKLRKILSIAGLTESKFIDAYNDAVDIFASNDVTTELSDRIKMCAALSFRRDGAMCDFGAYANLYPVVLSLLGMKVTAIDFYPQKDVDCIDYNEDLDKALAIYDSLGINVINADLYDVEIPGTFDIVTSFETFEHLWHSPKPILTKMVDALKDHGDILISVPNIARLTNRVKSLIGKSLLPNFKSFYHSGYPFFGHRREMTRLEVEWMLNQAGLSKRHVFTASLMPPLGDNPSLLGKIARMSEDLIPLPSGLRSNIFATYTKSPGSQ